MSTLEQKELVHERLSQMPPTRYIISNRPNAVVWHLGVRHDLCYAKSGLIASVSYLPACKRKQLGGAWGYSQHDQLPANVYKCPRCFKETRP